MHLLGLAFSAKLVLDNGFQKVIIVSRFEITLMKRYYNTYIYYSMAVIARVEVFFTSRMGRRAKKKTKKQ